MSCYGWPLDRWQFCEEAVDGRNLAIASRHFVKFAIGKLSFRSHNPVKSFSVRVNDGSNSCG